MENVILQPIEVGGQTFKNRIMFPPLTTGYEKNGMISEQDMGFYPIRQLNTFCNYVHLIIKSYCFV